MNLITFPLHCCFCYSMWLSVAQNLHLTGSPSNMRTLNHDREALTHTLHLSCYSSAVVKDTSRHTSLPISKLGSISYSSLSRLEPWTGEFAAYFIFGTFGEGIHGQRDIARTRKAAQLRATAGSWKPNRIWVRTQQLLCFRTLSLIKWPSCQGMLGKTAGATDPNNFSIASVFYTVSCSLATW